MSDDKFGSVYKPLTIKCLSVASPDPGKPYLCIVDRDGRQFYFRLTKGLNRHLFVQAGKCDDLWPEESA